MVEESLSRGVPPDRIGYFSFTKRAANEAVDRAVAKFGIPRTELRYFRTLHSMCFNALGLSNSDVFEGKKVVEFGHWLGVELSEMRFSDDGLMVGFTPGDRALFMENLARVRGIALRDQYEENHDNLDWNFVERVQRGLNQYKQDNDLLDYTDMLEHFCRAQWSPNLQELYIDESQDNSALQWQVVEKLASTCERVVVAGDDDQAIYRWAGAAVEHFVDMPGEPEVLGQSWRCPPEVQRLSYQIIDRVRHRREKAWSPRSGSGSVERPMSFSDVDVWGEDVLILARNAFLLRDIMPGLRQDGVLFEYKGNTSVSRPILDAVRTWELLRGGEAVPVDDVRRVYQYMSSGVGVRRGFKTLPGLRGTDKIDLAGLRESGGLMVDDIWHQSLDKIPTEEKLYLVRARQKGEKTTTKPRVRLSTIHSAKGAEAKHVVLLSDMATRTHAEMRDSPEDEARVWYVGVTRAREQLSVVAPYSNQYYEV